MSPAADAPGLAAPADALDVLVELLSEADAAEPTDDFHSRLCEAICRLTAMRRAVIFVHDSPRGEVRAAGAHGIALGLFAGAHLSPASAAIVRRALEEDRVIDVSEEAVERELPERFRPLLDDGLLTCTPLAAAGRWYGVVLADRAPAAGPLTDGQRRTLWTLGKMCALAASARIATRQHERARRLGERLDLARAVHERVVQRLFGVSLALSAGGELDGAARERCAAELQAALGELRATVTRPPSRARLETSLRDELRVLADLHADLVLRIVAGEDVAVPPALEPLAVADRRRPGRAGRRVRARGGQRRRARPGRPGGDGPAAGRVRGPRARRAGRVRPDRRRLLARAAGRAALSPPRKLRVLVVDDHDVVHWGFRLMLGEQGWVERFLAARTGEEALGLARRYEPHVALVDLFLGAESGAEVCARLRAASPVTRVLLISGAGRISVAAARAAGASGFVSKDWAAPDVARAVRMVGLGMTIFEPGEEPAVPAGLSEREREVLGLVATGATNREIAERLFLSPHTVKEYTSALYRKLEVRNRAEAVRRAQRLGLLG
ncbi:MAG TPA: LuxR C-terminal-related transcriptional regulator [Solirubrobacteraceae bacterium]